MTFAKRLGALGSFGRQSQNIWRDLKGCLPTCRLPDLHAFRTPFEHRTLGRFMKSASILLPHELLGKIYEEFPRIWTRYICPGPECVQQFWAAVSHTDQYRAHPVRDRETHQTMCIPVKLHGDGTPVTGLGKSWGRQVDCFSIASMLAYGPTVLTNFIIFMVHCHIESDRQGHNTLEVMYRKLKWSFEALWTGFYPTTDWLGRPLVGDAATKRGPIMGGHFVCLWALICDLDHACKAYKLPNSTSSTPCGWCPVNASTLPWFDFRLNACWLPRIWTHANWVAAGMKKSCIWDLPGVTIHTWKPDYMHIKSLGSDKVLSIGSYDGMCSRQKSSLLEAFKVFEVFRSL